MASSSQAGPPDYGMKLPQSYIATDGAKTFSNQDNLPSLPVPPLQQTLDRYLESVKPHVTDEEFRQTEFLVQQFGSGIGPDLHQKLLNKNNHARNWLEKWWEDYAYLAMRSPHAPYINFTGPGPYSSTHWPPMEGTQLERASLLTWFSMRYWEVLRTEKLKIDKGGRTVPWCMHQYKRMFNGCKTPQPHFDKLNDYFKTESEGPCPSYIVVHCAGRLFSFDILDEAGNIITAPEIKAQFTHIRNICDRQGAGPGLGAMTAENRDKWYQIREHLIGLHPDNPENLRMIQECIMTVTLDDQSPGDIADVSKSGLLGDSTNRWFDKALNFIIYKNGLASCNCDHSPFDGMCMVSILIFLYYCIEDSDVWRGPTTVRPMVKPKELVFHLDNKVLDAIEDAKKVFTKADESVEIRVEYFKGYGKDLIRKHKLHPDTYIQMALQLAYYRTYGRPAPTYETATTRKFYHGRTETVRSCTTEAVSFSRAMLDSRVNNDTRFKLMVQAIDKHNSNMAECMNNAGCDRHLFGLSLIAMEEGLPTPQIFLDKSWKKSGGGGNYILSTSFVGYTPVFGGVAPMCENGYGSFYSIQPDQVSFFISCWTTDKDTSCSRLFKAIETSLMDMKSVLESAPITKPKL